MLWCTRRVRKPQRCEAGMNSTQAGSIHCQPSLWTTVPTWLTELQFGFKAPTCVLTLAHKYTWMYLHFWGKIQSRHGADKQIYVLCTNTHPPPVIPPGWGLLSGTAPKPLWEREIRVGRWAVMAGARVSLLPGNTYQKKRCLQRENF